MDDLPARPTRIHEDTNNAELSVYVEALDPK